MLIRFSRFFLTILSTTVSSQVAKSVEDTKLTMLAKNEK